MMTHPARPPRLPLRFCSSRAIAAVASIPLLLAGCGDAGNRVNSPGTRPPEAPRVAPVLHATPPPPVHVQQVPGVEGVIGVDAEALIRQFGRPRLDVREGDARKLQFAGPPCVLDVYLYPLTPGRPPVASYVNARRGGDAREVDRAACITLLRQR